MYKLHGSGHWHFREDGHDPKDKDPCVTCLNATYEVVIERSVKIFHPHLVKIESGTYIGNETIIKGYPLNGSDSLPSVSIGKNCWIGERVYLHGAGHIKIEDRVGIGPNVSILTSHHESSGRGPLLDRPLLFKPVTIGEGADIEANAFICGGVKIGRGAIVRAGSVVTKDVPDYGIVQGNPAVLYGWREMEPAHIHMQAL